MRNDVCITVATVCYNASAMIERTLNSVAGQSYPNIEHIIVDGCSKDDTMQKVSDYANGESLHKIVVKSEPDKGLYDAMNKALQMASGDYIVFMNAGDKFHSVDTVRQIVDSLPEGELPGVVYGETDLVDDNGCFVSKRWHSVPEVLTWRSFLNGMLVCHQSFYARVDIARNTPYNLKYRLSADVDWCIRIMRETERLGLRLHNVRMVVTDYLSEGMTTQNHKASLKERFHVMTEHYGLFRTIIQHIWFVVRKFIK